MDTNEDVFGSLAKAGGAIGKGLIAGFAGTVAITISQMIEMKITGRQMSDAPVKVGGKVLGVEPKGKAKVEQEKEFTQDRKPTPNTRQDMEENKERFSQFMHFGYGTGWGVFRGAMDLAGVHGAAADLALFGGIWGTAQIMLPAATESKPITKWSAKQIAIDVFHHAVYAAAAGLVYECMRKAENKS
ncbi:hypothetical protein C7S20_13870 [Christiangramia fulva]|uniref:DUF1440 domain-containing protein n=1 Tax=Christiangramia fulva TaxID=2126553 RepID=A0A2R3Z7M0_9FLAO|nr:hypothetical protein [Christiangramia fulva]AVR46261.1 hypothetical protein C7S20_13870 [Christiangramia fulva]